MSTVASDVQLLVLVDAGLAVDGHLTLLGFEEPIYRLDGALDELLSFGMLLD